MHGHVVTPEDEPELHGVVDRLCALADMKKPRVAIAEVDMQNAFATGRNPSNAVVCATRGILRRLDEPELEAVLAHELSHVAHRDVAVMTIASFLGMIAGLLTRVMLYAGLFGGFGGGGGRNNQSGGQIALMEMGVLVVSAFAMLLVTTSARSRSARRADALISRTPKRFMVLFPFVDGRLDHMDFIAQQLHAGAVLKLHLCQGQGLAVQAYIVAVRALDQALHFLHMG